MSEGPIRNGLEDGFGFVPGESPLCISITAHERLRTLEEQVDNIAACCPRALVMLHLNAGFARSIRSDAALGLRMRQLLRRRGVMVNPLSYPTRWAHMLHAHVSNIRHIRDSGLQLGSIMLMSSGDLMFRPGLEEHVAGFDAGATQRRIHPDWQWTARVRQDAVAARLLERSGHDDFRTSDHEGSFYRAAIAFRMIEVLDELIPDWEYNDAYPKEEVFFPTLAALAGARSFTLPAGHMLGFRPTDRRYLAQVFRAMGFLHPGPRTLLHDWIEEHAAGEDMTANRFIVSRIPREHDTLIRSLFAGLAPEEGSARANWVARHLDAWDIAELDQPGRTNIPAAATLSRTAALALLDGARGADGTVFDFQAPGTQISCTLPRCDSYSAALPLAGESFLAARAIRAAAQLSLAETGDGLTLEVSVDEATSGPGEPPIAFFGQRLDLRARQPRAVVAELDEVGDPLPDLAMWLELHLPEAGGLRKQSFPLPRQEIAQDGRAALVWAIGRGLLQSLKEGSGQVFIYLSLPAPCPPLRLSRLVFLA